MSVSKENSSASEVLDALAQRVHVQPENLRLTEVCPSFRAPCGRWAHSAQWAALTRKAEPLAFGLHRGAQCPAVTVAQQLLPWTGSWAAGYPLRAVLPRRWPPAGGALVVSELGP